MNARHHELTQRFRPSTLVGLLRYRAQNQPDQVAFTFLKDGEKEDGELTYAEFDRRARAIAAHLQNLHAAGERALLLYPSGLDYMAAFFGCLYAGVVAVPAYPPRQNQNLLRLKSIINDAKAAFVLTTRQILPVIKAGLGEDTEFRGLRLIDTTGVEDLAQQWREPPLTADATAFLQYTSGSTGTPKGVVLTHENLLHNSGLMAEAFQYRGDGNLGVSWLPLYHDMGLIGGFLQPLYCGYRCIVMSPASFLQRPWRWLQAISTYRATISAGPNFAYDLCVRRIGPEQRGALDLSCWETAISGAEPVRSSTLEEFSRAFEVARFRKSAFFPCYGLAEATLMVSGAKRAAPIVKNISTEALERNRIEEADPAARDGRSLVGCGGSLPGQTIAVVDPSAMTRCEPGRVGEIWVSGKSVGRGYWGREELSNATFRAQVDGDGPYLRTGDLGVFLDGELFITGRLKDLLIIRGRNHYPQDIEYTVEQCDALLRPSSGAAFSVDDGTQEQLVVVQEVVPKGVVTPALADKIRAEVAKVHELQIQTLVLIAAGSIPKTSSGKIQRQACKQKFLAGELESVFVWQSSPGEIQADELPDVALDTTEAIEAWLIGELAARLQVAPDRIDKYRPISAYHLDSLAAIEMLHRIETRFGMSVSFDSFLQDVSVAGLAAQAAPVLPIERVPRDGALPLSYGQQRLWFLWQLESESYLYNVFSAYRVRGRLDVSVLTRCFGELMARHEVLRTTFVAGKDGPIAKISAQQSIDPRLVELQASGNEEIGRLIAEETKRPFDLEHGPLLRLMIVRAHDSETILVLTLHHIIFDGWSAHVLIRELAALYDALSRGQTPASPASPVQYVDFAHWQREHLAEKLESQLQYWKDRLQGANTVLDLPTDKPRPAVQQDHGDKRRLILPPELVRSLRRLSEREHVTLFMVLLSAIFVLLGRYTRQENVLVGTPIAGRNRSELENLVGFFINTLVMRADFPPSLTVVGLLRQVRENVLDAYRNQDLPFHKLLEDLRVGRDLSRSPLFQAMFTFHNLRREKLALAGAELEPLDIDNNTTTFDLSFSMIERDDDSIECAIKYKTDLFEARTIERMLEHLERILDGMARDPNRPVSQISMLTESENAQLRDWNATEQRYPAGETIHGLIERRAAQTPQAVALAFEGAELSYAELNARANRLARYLQARGVGPDERVGIAVERSFEMVIALLGVLKAGGAYVPLDPDYPPERLEYMLQDSQVRVLLTQRKFVDKLTGSGIEAVCMDEASERLRDFDSTNPAVNVRDGNLAYIIYTSGSTGRPKGAMNSHEAIYNRLQWMQQAYSLTPDDAVLQKTPFSFDVSVWEFFWPLMFGARLVIAKPRGHMDRDYLVRLIAEQGITTIHFVPSMLQVFLEATGVEKCGSLKRVICSGEALPLELQKRFFARLKAQLHNLYGPTEAAVDVTSWACIAEATRVPIGKPIANVQIHILDAAMQPVPVGVAGELHIAGIGLARGYWNRPELTAEKFIPDPFSANPGRRLYRTGDLARFLPDGDIEYLGRIDFQVKLRGFRIELGEIESVLLQHAAVKEAIVLLREDTRGDQRLVAYVTRASAPCEAGELRDYLKHKLAEHMVPSAIVFMDALPLTPNGKVDRRALPAPEGGVARVAYVAPRNDVEKTIVAMWEQVLNGKNIGVHDNFFELGGHSLLLTKIASRIRETFQVEVPLHVLFDAPTVEQMTLAIAKQQLEQEDAAEVDKLLREFENLTDEQISALLAAETQRN